MAKVGYIFMANQYDMLEADKEWMLQYGCVQVFEESTDHEILRPLWKQLMASIERGDEIVVSKFSNAVRGTRELATFLELCRIKDARIISIHDGIDTKDELFPDTKVSDVIKMFGSLPEEIAALRKSSSHIMHLQQYIKQPSKTGGSISKTERERMIVDMYNNGHSIDDIFEMSGFSSRSSVFRILNKYGVKLNRGKFSGPRNKNKKNKPE
ncbi:MULTISPECIES: recombinase family protein [Bacteroidaceae]|jgi:DNA invertase Pin-like site-specific DNA recombinase|uniref:recombinase family protein n=1 Tax=Bacteroidaceae TaxID=815 RepID=UPI0008D9F1FC|nr:MULTISPECIES: recombinase family protein [Bacteroides]